MTRAAKPGPRPDTVGRLLDQLGVPADRVRLDPPPGQATKRDLLRLHGRAGRLYELVDRTLVEKPVGYQESILGLDVAFYLRLHLREHDLGFLAGADGLVELLPDLVRGPDVSFVPWQKRPDRTYPDDRIGTSVPDLAVEVLSPKNTRPEVARKLKDYFLAGVRLVWVIDPVKRTAAVYTAPDVRVTLDESAALDGGDVLPGFRLPLATLFERVKRPAAKKSRKKK